MQDGVREAVQGRPGQAVQDRFHDPVHPRDQGGLQTVAGKVLVFIKSFDAPSSGEKRNVLAPLRIRAASLLAYKRHDFFLFTPQIKRKYCYFVHINNFKENTVPGIYKNSLK